MRNWVDDLRESKRIFIDTVYPEIKHWFNDAELIPVEGIEDIEMAVQLDQTSGIDFWVIETEKGMYGLASRTQPRTDAKGTFTVRRTRFTGNKTEFKKRKQQIKNGYLYPEYTVQAYTRYGELENAAVIRTEDLINYIDEGRNHQDYWINETHNADFYCVHWLDIGLNNEIEIHQPRYDYTYQPLSSTSSTVHQLTLNNYAGGVPADE